MTPNDKFIDLGETTKDSSPETIDTNPPGLPSVGVKAGWKTSSVQLSAVFVVASMILSAFGYHSFTPEKMQNWYDMVVPLLLIVGPILAQIPVINNVVNSRGKIISNSINATAALNMSALPQTDGPQLATNFLGGKWGKIGSIAGAVLGSGLIPGKAGQIGTVASQILPAVIGSQSNDVSDDSLLTVMQNQQLMEANAKARHDEMMKVLNRIAEK